jgi:hypothetical protein
MPETSESLAAVANVASGSINPVEALKTLNLESIFRLNPFESLNKNQTNSLFFY